MKWLVIVLCLVPMVVAIGQKKKTAKVTRVEAMLSHYNTADNNAHVVRLPHRVSEASGIVMTQDGRLLCHDDERGVVYQINYSTGEIVKFFSLGRFGVTDDFEDIAVKDKLVYLIASGGTLYEFPEAENGRSVEFRMHRTSLSQKNDVEGLCYDASTDCLLLLCKESPGKHYRSQRAVYAFSLRTRTLAETPRFLIPLDRVTKTSDNHEFQPSAITKHPTSGTYFIVAAHGSTIIELSSDGKILGQQSINKKLNPHPEGIAFAPDLTLILCNDGQGERGTLTLYPYQGK